jgi:hypothetical protein
LNLKVPREVGVFAVQNNGGYYPDRVDSTWKSSIGKIYTVSNNCRFASWYNTILVDVGDLMRLVFTLETSSKSRGSNCIGVYTGFFTVIEAASSLSR